MKEIIVNILLLNDNAKLPFYATSGSSGLDLSAVLQESVVLKPMQRLLISTGCSIELPSGYEAQIRSRSGLALKNGIIVLNSPGTVDSDYRGEIKVILANFGQEDFTINNGDKIAQMVISEIVKAKLTLKTNLVNTQRGAGGFGSTGVSNID